MQFTFLNPAGAVLFVRDDLESGDWTVEEYTVNATFPYIAGKVIERGQRLAFRNPATNTLEVFEVRNVTNIEPEHYQQIIAEHIAVSELSDDHINTQEITDQTPAQVLATVLTGTLWAVGNVTDTTVSSADISRGSVWQAVCTIQANWNVYITPRVTVNAAGAITGRYLDVAPAHGTWRGVRLSISKNMTDASVVYDDSEVYTALYGYGGSVDKPQTGGDDETEELTFADVVWTATAEHPAKPAGQTYLEDPAATALYGRNGRPRFGYYQNSGIDDAETLLEKTWESLKQCRKPKISIAGTVTDLYRLGYTDQPLRLHDTAIVEIAETGEKFEKEIIKLRIDLVDPTATTPEIGDYIPNIIYIERETGTNAGGGGGGGRSPGSETNQYNTYAGFDNRTDKYGSMIAMVVGTRNGNNYVKGGEIALSINAQDQSTRILLQADAIDIDGLVSYFEAEGFSCGDLDCQGSLGVDQDITCDGTVSGYVGTFDSLNVTDGTLDCLDIDCNDIDAAGIACSTLKVGANSATWQTYSARWCGLSTAHYFLYSSGSGNTTPSGTSNGRIVTSYTDTTLHYLGY